MKNSSVDSGGLRNLLIHSRRTSCKWFSLGYSTTLFLRFSQMQSYMKRGSNVERLQSLTTKSPRRSSEVLGLTTAEDF